MKRDGVREETYYVQPKPRLSWKEMGRWNSPRKGGDKHVWEGLKLCTTLPGVSHFPRD